RRGRKQFRRICQFLSPLQLPFSTDDLRTTFTLRLRFTGHGSLHFLRQIDLFYFDHDNFNAPGFGVLIENPLQSLIHLIAMHENFIQMILPHDRTQSRLRQLAGGKIFTVAVRSTTATTPRKIKNSTTYSFFLILRFKPWRESTSTASVACSCSSLVNAQTSP